MASRASSTKLRLRRKLLEQSLEKKAKEHTTQKARTPANPQEIEEYFKRMKDYKSTLLDEKKTIAERLFAIEASIVEVTKHINTAREYLKPDDALVITLWGMLQSMEKARDCLNKQQDPT